MKLNERIIILLLTFAVFVSCLPAGSVVRAQGEDEWPFKISKKSIKDVSISFTGKNKIYEADKAASAGIPEGYSGKVISVGKGTSTGITFDFTDAKIRAANVESITFRYYVESTKQDDSEYPELRIILPHRTTNWAMRRYTGNDTDKWTEFTLYKDGKNFHRDYLLTAKGDNAFSVFADEDGYLAYFELYVRRHSGEANFYIDDVIIKYIDDDGVPPVITVPSDTVRVPYGSTMQINASAYDEKDGLGTPVEYSWKDESCLDENGNPTIGEHILIISSEDNFGNMAVKEITVIVTEPDTVPPSVNLNVHDIYVPTGTKPQLRPTASDDNGTAECSGQWSEGAVNEYGRLTEGLHTYTVTARDLSGNETVYTVNFHVGEKNPAYG